MTNTSNGMPLSLRKEADILTPIELGVLEACLEVINRQKEILPLLAEELQVSTDEVFYHWAFRRCKQSGQVRGTCWVYFFHGLECDLKDTKDGRFIRVDFGPQGRVDTFTSWGVLQFIMTSVNPWPEYPELKEFFTQSPPPYNQYSGSSEKMSSVWDRLEEKGVFEKADSALLELQKRHTFQGPDGLAYIKYPPEISEKMALDCLVAHRLRLSNRGLEILKGRILTSQRELP